MKIMKRTMTSMGVVGLFLLLALPSFHGAMATPASKSASRLALTSDFKIAANTPISAGSEFHDVGIASDGTHGFLVVWRNDYTVGSVTYFDNYACRISPTGEVLDASAIYVNDSPWPYYCPSAVFLGGNWIVSTNQASHAGLLEWAGVARISPSGVVLDNPPVNVCDSFGGATLLWPTIATNGQVLLCVTGITAEGIYASICDPNLNVLVPRFEILRNDVSDSAIQVAANGENFFIVFLNWLGDLNMKLVIVSPQGKILSIQNVNTEAFTYRVGAPSVTTRNGVTYVSYFNTPDWRQSAHPDYFVRRYSSDGTPIDPAPVKMVSSQDFPVFLSDLSIGIWVHAYTDLVWTDAGFHFFWPRMSSPGINLMSFSPELVPFYSQPLLVNDQCQYKIRYGNPANFRSRSIIRAASNGSRVLTAWIDGREGNGRVYGALFNDLTPVTHTLNLTAGTGGTTDPAPGTYSYNSGTKVTITASPASGYTFSGWSGDASGTTNPLAVTLDANKSIKANFSQTSGGGGGDNGGEAKSKCFIATACFGTPLAKEVRILRDFRDKVLIGTPIGKAFVGLYEEFGPKMAAFIRDKEVLKKLVRMGLRPIIGIASRMI
jgi:uncharacterized repeat protein (TIGR02543 family)